MRCKGAHVLFRLYIWGEMLNMYFFRLSESVPCVKTIGLFCEYVDEGWGYG